MEQKYTDFFDEIEKFFKKQNKQKQRGLNNYNILTSVLEPHDEVRLHSRMIYSFLNPQGEHFQGTLFLEKFLEVLQISDFLDLSNCSIHKEYENIDLYITDGSKHIIIENKVYAGDQNKQIQRYVDIILKENKVLEVDNILVIYLSLDRKKPSKESLGNLELNGNYLIEKDKKVAGYKSISYEKEILQWLEKCQYEVQNITNLNEALKQYMDVVKIINNKYKEKIMSIENHLTKDISTYKIAMEIYESLPKMRKSIVEYFIKNELVKYLKIELGEGWIVKIQDKSSLSSRHGFPLIVYKKDWLNDKKSNLIFGFEFNNSNYYDGVFGVIRWTDMVDIENDIVKNEKFKNSLEGIEHKTTTWWLHQEGLNKGDFAKFIEFDTSAKETIKKRIIEIINTFENELQLITKINTYLNEKENQA
jgi:hypothetical protein